MNFNPRPLAGATSGSSACPASRQNFNPRPLAGATGRHINAPPQRGDFNPRPLAGATHDTTKEKAKRNISIHAPLRGRRVYGCLEKLWIQDFNPRPLAGATSHVITMVTANGFQSTPPCGGDPATRKGTRGTHISIHAPLRGRLSDGTA